MAENQKIDELRESLLEDFDKKRILLSYGGYLDLVAQNPKNHIRNAPAYLRDVFDSYGKEKIGTWKGNPVYRFGLFEKVFESRGISLVGQERAQTQVYDLVTNAVGEGLSNKMILLHGPNGSSKSTFLSAVMKGIEEFSKSPDGAIYSFSWIFPLERKLQGGLGLGRAGTQESGSRFNVKESYAGLSEELIAAKVHCEFHDHPLLLIPVEYRRKIIGDYLGEEGKEFLKNNLLMSEGSLCPKCRSIFSELLTSFKGDIGKVLRHIQVERLFISERDSKGAVTVEPQMYVDAKSRQLTMDQNIAELPPVLKSLNLYEFTGALPQSNRGIIEFQDLLKRPIDTFRYLLSACEEGRISVGGMIAFLDVVWMGSTNDLELDEFKEYPDFTSFKARMELVQVPYLLQISKEREIYDQKIKQIAPEKHVAPHTTWVVALWAILTRLKKPNPNRYPPELGYVISNLTPLEKAQIYSDAQMPDNLTTEERNHLKANMQLIAEEFGEVPYYEGRIGASPREMISTLYRAASLPEHQCLTPLATLKALGELVQKSDQYMFLKQEPQGGYHDPKKFIAIVRQEYMDVLDSEIRDALGLVEQKTYHDLIEKYVDHVRHLIKNEKIQNPMTGSFEEPDKKFIEKFEKMVQVKDPDVFRQNILSSIASWAIENKKNKEKSAPLSGEDYANVFSDLIKNLEEHYFSQQKELLQKLSRALQIYGSKEEDKSSNERKRLHNALENLKNEFEYCEHCGLEAISFLLKSKYS